MRQLLLVFLLPTASSLFAPPRPCELVTKGAEAALRAVLRECGEVEVGIAGDVRFTPSVISVGGATLRGRRWRSPRGLTCRRIDAHLGTMGVATPPLVAFPPQVELSRVAVGTAECLFDATDFSNFLTHPSVFSAVREHRERRMAATAAATAADAFVFDRRGVAFDAGTNTARFRGRLEGAATSFDATLSLEMMGARVRAVERSTGEPMVTLSDSLTEFFNALRVDLDGVTLRFGSFKVVDNVGPDSAIGLMLTLPLEVAKLPSLPALKF